LAEADTSLPEHLLSWNAGNAVFNGSAGSQSVYGVEKAPQNFYFKGFYRIYCIICHATALFLKNRTSALTRYESNRIYISFLVIIVE